MTIRLRRIGNLILTSLLVCFTAASIVQADYTLSPDHPRVLITPAELSTIVDRISGPTARLPYTDWYARILARETIAQTGTGTIPDPMSIALIYHAALDPEEKSTHLTWYLDALDSYLDNRVAAIRSDPNANSGPSFTTSVSMDLMWTLIPDQTKLKAFEAASGRHAFHQNSGENLVEQDFYYRGASGRARAFAFAALFDGDPILSHPDAVADPSTYSFDTSIYIEAMVEELSDSGHFWQMENRVAGDMTYNTALPGDFGGMYDNIGNDSTEASWSIFLVASFSAATDQDRLSEFLHDRYRGRFYQNMEKPYAVNQVGSGDNAFSEHRLETVGNTRTDSITSPNTNSVALVAYKYRDPYMQYYVDRWRKELNLYDYDYYVNQLWRMLCFYDDNLIITPPSDNPTARYFSGPGLVSMRENWSDTAAFAAFMAGEGIGHRYEDANSFVLSRKGPIVVHAGTGIGSNEDNDKHHWYNIRSISKNTMKIFDPQESFDVDAQGRITALHSGTPLVNSDNMGGQLHETGISGQDGLYTTGLNGTLEMRSSDAFDLGLWNTADITAYEHVADAYTYAKGDGTDAYTQKIDYFEREFVYLRPDVFVLFDRVRSADPSFTKSWTIHTVDQPVGETAGQPMSQDAVMLDGNRRLDIDNGRDRTTLFTVLPVSGRTIVSGGNTVLATGLPLNSEVEIGADVIETLDIPRRLEVFAVGEDTVGSVTLHGDAAEGVNISETLTFSGTVQTYFAANSTPENGTQVVFFENDRVRHTGMQWQPDQWAGYMLETSGGSNPLIAITGNSADQLQLSQAIDGTGVLAYAIVRPLANTNSHWTKINRITTNDMDLSSLALSAPHYFDARGADGTRYTLAPPTEAISDDDHKQTDMGKWTVDIESTEQRHLTHYLNVFCLGDSGTQAPSVTGFEGNGASGAVIGDRLVVFAHEPGTLDEVIFTPKAAGNYDALIFNLHPETTYYVSSENGQVTVSSTSNRGSSATTSAMGVLRADIVYDGQDSNNPDSADSQPGGSGGGGGCFLSALWF